MPAKANKRKKSQRKKQSASDASNPGSNPAGTGKAAPNGFDPARTEAANGLVQQGIAQHQTGDVAAAEELYRKALEIEPENPHALHFLGVVLHQKGENAQAVDLIERSIARNPGFADAHSNLGAALFKLKRLPEAAEHFRRAAELQPAMSEAHSNLAAVLKEQGKTKEAIESYKSAHQASPAAPKFVKRLADLYLEHEQFEDAIDWFERYLALAPDDAEVWSNMGYAHERRVDLEQAERCYRRAVELWPDSPEINNNLASTLNRLGRSREAEEYFKRSIEIDPEKWSDHANLARTYANRKQFALAFPIFEKVIESRTDDHELLNDYGIALSMSGRLDEAKDVFERVITLKPDYAEAYNALGSNRFEAHDRDSAIEAFKQALKLKPQFAECLNNLCFPLALDRRYDEAYMYAKAATILDDYHPTKYVNPLKVFNALCDFDAMSEASEVWENLDQLPPHMISKCALTLLAISDDDVKTKKLFDAHGRWGVDYSNNAAQFPLPPAPAHEPGSKIRLGFMSSDLRNHSVGHVMKPLLEHYDRDRFEIYCYSPWDDENDALQNRIKEWVTDFKTVTNPSQRDLALTIRDDKVDILFDLNGFTLHNRLGTMAYRAAPVQIFWLGYPFTIGLPEIDYILLDDLCKPTNADWLHETALIMPESWVSFGELDPIPIDPELPFERNGAITFGSQNNPNKFTRPMVALWCEIMKQVPDSRFLLVRPECSSLMMCTNITQEFERNGITSDRIYFVDNRVHSLNHLIYYNEIDISLDTFPITGGNTTVDAIWMGVPIISLVGDSLNQRLSYSLMTNAGIGDLCAYSPEEYMAKAVALAGDHDVLREIRYELRPEYLKSPLGQTERFAENFQNLMEDVARKHGLV